MIRFILIVTVAYLSQAAMHADAQSDQRLAELLQPNISFTMLPGQPKPLSEPKAILPITVPAKFDGQPPRLQFAAMKSVLPYDPAEPAPLVAYTAKPQPAQEIVFQTTPPIALPIVDVNIPPPLPILAKPKVDRAPLTDATLEFSFAVILKAVMPPRAQQVPFVPMNLPDPFELQTQIRQQNPLAEDFQPMAGPPRILLQPEPVKAPAK